MNVLILGRWVMDASITGGDARLELLAATRSLIVAIVTTRLWLFVQFVIQSNRLIEFVRTVVSAWGNISVKFANSTMMILRKGSFIAMIVGSAGSCYSINLRDNHQCVENSMRHHCPICYEYLFDSLKDTTVMKCGHTMHCECYHEMIKRDKYCCPICSKSVIDMSRTWKRIDEEIEATMMPEDYRYKKVTDSSLPISKSSYRPTLRISISIDTNNGNTATLSAPVHSAPQRLSNLRIHDNFNCNLCREVTKASVHVGALDFAKKALWKHNVYGLTPNVGSAHQLLSYAKDHKDAKLMGEVMKLLKLNGLPLQPGTADIVFRICYDTDDWELISKYAKRFVMAGVKLRQTSFEIWMEFAAKIVPCIMHALAVTGFAGVNGAQLVRVEFIFARVQRVGVYMCVERFATDGDTESLWKIEKLRSESMKQHSLVTGFSCAKGFLLERKPEEAAAVIQILNQTLSDAKKPGIMVELQKLVDWPFDVLKRQKQEDKKALATALKSDIQVMVTALLSHGLKVNVNLDDLAREEGVLA
ncbi:hypothetical protein JRO89_XS03G0181600 [Xanthoceras sorbifolium]|uniref:RING-type domain-containing protein n=1 Tax=Xanthoceras sorbifolium TaxID=99658 RepID=A0ABQ8IAF0_9ROSI|nr:hypothetical protein JRO89_XS03G0181600 [Xanthoceras sorbifolium]